MPRWRQVWPLMLPESAVVRHDVAGNFLDEDREPLAVLERDGFLIGHLELDREAEDPDIPVARSGEIGDRNPEMVELDHALSFTRVQIQPMNVMTRTG